MKYLERNECQDVLDEMRNLIGDDSIINFINDYFSADDVSGFLEKLNDDYDLDLPQFE